MNKTTFPLGVLVLTIALFTVLSLTGCKDKPDDPPPPQSQPHQTTITAFDRDITVTGDAALSTDDFNTAKGKLQEAMTALDGWLTGTPGYNNFVAMINRTGFAIIIGIGNAEPDADANKSMTIGIDYLLTNDANTTIPTRLNKIVVQDDAFATPTPPLYTNPATITQGTPNGLAFAGSVTIKSDDTYTPAAWDAVVANVITAFNAAYEGAEDTFDYDLVGNEGDGIQIVLVNDLAKNWEVKSGTKYGTLYIKTSSILTIIASSYGAAMLSVSMNNPSTSLTNAAPPQRRAFLALAREKSSYAL